MPKVAFLIDADLPLYGSVVRCRRSDVRMLDDREAEALYRLHMAVPAGDQERISPLRFARSDPPEVPVSEVKRYSLVRALRSALASQPGPVGVPTNGIELEMHQELSRTLGPPRGFWVPAAALLARGERRALDTAAGTGSIATILPPDRYVDALRARSVLAALGAQFLDLNAESGRAGKVALPRKTAPAAVAWVGESAPASDTAMVLNQVTFTPKTVTAATDITRKMLASATADFEDFVAEDITRGIAVAIDAAGLNGLGSGSQPLGVLQDPRVPVVALGTDGGAPTRAKLIAMEQAVGNANADAAAGATLGWVTSPNGRAKCRSVDGSAGGSGKWLWSDDDRILGKPAYATSNMPNAITKGNGSNLSALVYGNWSDLIVNAFSAVDVLMNPYLFSTSGVARVVVHQDVDVEILHAESFQAAVDMVTS